MAASPRRWPSVGEKILAHPVLLERGDLRGDDHTSTAAVDADVAAAGSPEPIDEVCEVLHVSALVRADGDTLHILGDSGADDLVHGAVVAQVDDFGTLGLQDAAHDVDGGVVSVEQAGGAHEPDRVEWAIQLSVIHLIYDSRTSYYFPGELRTWRA